MIYWFKVYYKWVESKTHSVVPWGTLMYGLKYSTAGEKDLRAVPLQWNVLQITYSSFHNLLYLIFHYSSYTYCECGTMLFYLIYLFIFCHKISNEQFFSKMYRELNDTNFKPEIG